MNRFTPSLRRAAQVGIVIAVSALAYAGTSVAAQDGDEPHPAHIHAGTCAELGDVVVPLTDVTYPEGTASGPESAHPVKISEGNRVEIPLADIIDGGHAINVHLSAEEIGTYIACGDIGGIVHDMEGGDGSELVIALQELNDSGHVGTAWLGEVDGATMVTVALIEPDEMGAASTEAAQDAAPADAAAEATAVEIVDFAYNPPSVTVPVGGSVTWTNADGVPHTFFHPGAAPRESPIARWTATAHQWTGPPHSSFFRPSTLLLTQSMPRPAIRSAAALPFSALKS
jgi:plastocyanin